MPTTTSERTSIVAKTGRRTQSWASACMAMALLLHLNGSAIVERALVAGSNGLVACEAACDPDEAAIGIAGDHDAEVRRVVIDREHLERVGSLIADDGIARHE